MVTEDDLKVCSHCKVSKPRYAYSKDKSRKDGKDDFCKDCRRIERLKKKDFQNIYTRRYQQKNREANEDMTEEYIDYLHKKGYFITKDAQQKNYRFNLDIKPWKGKLYKIGIVSDTHLGSRYQQLTNLHKFYKICQEEDIREVFHCGDLLDGQKVYKGHEYEIFMHGVDSQVRYCIENYPDHNDITTFFIAGNHDESHYKISGVDIGLLISKERKDMQYKGFYGAHFIIKGVDIYLHHGQGGMSYARCFDEKTEILTKDGWKYFKDITMTDTVATRNNEGYLEYQKPNEIFNYDYKGDMLHFVSRRYDLLVTPNHNMFCRQYPLMVNRKTNLTYPTKSHQRVVTDWRILEAEKLVGYRQRWQFNQEVNWIGKEEKTYKLPIIERRRFSSKEPHHFRKINMDLWLQFLGWYVSEGNTSGKNHKKYVTIITQLNINGRRQLLGLFKKLKWDVCVYGRKTFSIHGGELANHLDDICGVGSKNKRVPEFIKNLSIRQIRIFLQSALDGDGCFDKRFGRYNHYTTYSNTLRNDMQELFLKAGWGATMTKRGVSLAYEQLLPTLNIKPERVKYDGKIYCCEVPNHVILVRRNGRVIWSGNSYKIQKMVEQMAPENKPHMFFLGHYHVGCHLPMYRNVYMWQMPCFQSQTPYLLTRGLEPESMGLIVSFRISEGKPYAFEEKKICFHESKKEDY